MSEIKKIYGIDLGTTYSCIAHIDKNGEPAIIPNAEGDLTTPSVVYIESGENVVVGTVAKQSAEMEPNRVVDFVKRSMGDENFAFEVDGREYKPEEVSSFILRKLVKDASSYLGEPITDVVITCPAYFGIKEREATKNAGKIAELNVHNVLNEPTAAAFSYGLDRAEEDQVVVVYDLGGGTFDVTMIEIKGKDISVITTGGDHHLGGKDWDDRIIEYFATEFMNAHGENQDPRDDLFTMQDLRNKAEEAKKILTAKEKYKTVVSYEGERTEIELTREKFEELTMDLLNRTIELTKTMLEDAKNKGHSQVTTMLLVGGASRMPMVTPKIKSEFGLEPMLYEPDQAIAKGAALIALKKFAEKVVEATDGDTGVIEEIAKKAGIFLPGEDIADRAQGIITPISSKAFGVVAVRLDENNKQIEYVHHMIDRHAHLPAEITETGFGTVNDNQTVVLIKLMEQADGNFEPSEELGNNILLTEGHLTELPPNLPAGSPIHVTFRLEEDGRLSVHAVEPSTSKECVLNAKVTGVMSEEEVIESKEALLGINVS